MMMKRCALTARCECRLQHEDAQGRTALDLALFLGSWEAVGMLLRAGALAGFPRMAAAVAQVSRAMPADARRLVSTGASSSREPARGTAALVGTQGSAVDAAVAAALPLSLSTIGSRAFSMLPPGLRGLLTQAATATPGTPTLETEGQAVGPAAVEGSSECVEVVGMSDIARHLQHAVQRVRDSLGVDEAQAAALLVANNYDVEAAMRQGAPVASGGALVSHSAGSGPGSPCTSASGSGSASAMIRGTGRQGTQAGTEAPQAALPASSPLMRCMVCYEEQDVQALAVRLPCQHPDVTCNACWRHFILERLSEGECCNLGQRKRCERLSSSSGPSQKQISQSAGWIHLCDKPCTQREAWHCALIPPPLFPMLPSSGQPHRIGCPWPDCGLQLSLNHMQRLLSPQELTRVEDALAKHFVAVDPTTTWCPRPGCEAVVRLRSPDGQAQSQTGRDRAGQAHTAVSGGGGASGAGAASVVIRAGRGVAAVCRCGTRFCFACKASPPHEPASCDQVQDWQRVQAQLSRELQACTENWLQHNTKPCPRCKARIQKAGGCLHMTCRNCQHHFCWLCSRPFPGAHDDVFSCMAADVEADPAGGGQGALRSAVAGVQAGVSTGGLYDALSGLWGRMTAVAVRRRQEHYLRRYLAFSGGTERAEARVGRMQLLLHAASLGPATPPLQQTEPSRSAAATSVAGPAAGLRTARLAPGTAVQIPYSGPLPSQALELPADCWWQRWQDSLSFGREVLSNSFILAYHTSDAAHLRQLGQLQGRLALALEALAAPLEALPGPFMQSLDVRGARQTPLQHTAAHRAPVMTSNVTKAMVRSLLVAIGTSLLHAGAALPAAYQRQGAGGGIVGSQPGRGLIGAAAAPAALAPSMHGNAAGRNEQAEQEQQQVLDALHRIPGREAAPQLLFTLALLRERRQVLDQLMDDANCCALAIVRAARAGLGGSSSSGVVLGPLDVIINNVLGG